MHSIKKFELNGCQRAAELYFGLIKLFWDNCNKWEFPVCLWTPRTVSFENIYWKPVVLVVEGVHTLVQQQQK